MKDVVIISGSRTPIGAYGGTLKTIPVADLGALVIRDSLEKVGLRPVADKTYANFSPNALSSGQPIELEQQYSNYSDAFQPVHVDEIILGNVLSAGLGQNVARQAMIRAGVPKETTASSVNKSCASGMEAVALASQVIACGNAEIVIAGGVENMSQVPYTSPVSRWGDNMTDNSVVDLLFHDGLHEIFYGYHIGITAENIAQKFEISREEQDELALLSHKRAINAMEKSFFKAEIVPIPIPRADKEPTIFSRDECPSNMTAEKLSRLHPAFKEDGTVTAGNSSTISDGATALLLMSRDKALELGLKPLALIHDFSSAGIDPAYAGLGPIPAMRKILDRNNYSIDDFDRVELNETFAAQAIACIRELGLRLDKTNIQGSGISLGHPLGSTGARIILSLASQMAREDHCLGLASLCAGGGQGMALALERC